MMTSLFRSTSTLALVACALIVSGCSETETPTNPTGIPNVSGTWTGTYRIRGCTDTVNGVPGTVCTPLTGPTAPLQPLRLSLTQSDDRVVGNLEFTGWYVRSLLVTGTVSGDAGVALEGTTTFTDAACPAVQNRATLTSWASTVNRTLDGMVGTFRFNGNIRIGTTGCVYGEVSIEADTLNLTKP